MRHQNIYRNLRPFLAPGVTEAQFEQTLDRAQTFAADVDASIVRAHVTKLNKLVMDGAAAGEMSFKDIAATARAIIAACEEESAEDQPPGEPLQPRPTGNDSARRTDVSKALPFGTPALAQDKAPRVVTPEMARKLERSLPP